MLEKLIKNINVFDVSEYVYEYQKALYDASMFIYNSPTNREAIYIPTKALCRIKEHGDNFLILTNPPEPDQGDGPVITTNGNGDMAMLGSSANLKNCNTLVDINERILIYVLITEKPNAIDFKKGLCSTFSFTKPVMISHVSSVEYGIPVNRIRKSYTTDLDVDIDNILLSIYKSNYGKLDNVDIMVDICSRVLYDNETLSYIGEIIRQKLGYYDGEEAA